MQAAVHRRSKRRQGMGAYRQVVISTSYVHKHRVNTTNCKGSCMRTLICNRFSVTAFLIQGGFGMERKAWNSDLDGAQM
ncbi:hypothetical protein EJB05_29663 [Eragrostis curvula]|uniref:Uncharacterized protein n=1 Tax=Eragrostis curvula TaxID=38414 RepID=A0A5J9UUL9_9POAL|nr:hypothetical protein EJB05_29663 [Eragrostis curvula]